ncbi:MAG: diguanylate cyclase [Stagnimonas sp.]|nr:diguanylate cyclase [Stagnimonas sp.]
MRALFTGPREHLWPRAGAALALLCTVLLLALSLRALWSAQALQNRLDRAWALDSARQRLSEPLRQGSEAALDAALAAIIEGESWGFRYLAVLDTDGQAVAARGRYQSLSSRWLPKPLTNWLRRRLYTGFGEVGRLSLREAGRGYGALEYAIGADTGRLVRDEAVDRLRSTGLIGALLALAFGAGSLLVLRHQLRRRTAPLAARLGLPEAAPAPPTATPATAAPALADTFDALGIGILLVDAELRVRAINATAVRLTGWVAADALGQLAYTVFQARDDEGTPLASPVERCLQQSASQGPKELRLRPRGGSTPELPVEASASLHPLPDGGRGGLLAFQDISGRIADRQRLREQAQFAEGVVDHLSEGVLTTDSAGLIKSVNARAQRLFGYSAEEMLRMTVPRLLPVPFMNTPGLRLSDYVAGGSARMPKVAGWRKDATTFPAELLVEPMRVSGEDRLVVVVRDITERQRSQGLAQRLGRLLDAASEEVYVFDAQSLYFIEVNRGARRNLGLKPEQLARMSLTSIATDLDPATLQAHLAKLRGGDSDHLSYKTRHRRADGSTYPVEVRLSFSREEEPPVFMAIALDISEREAAERRMQQLAHYDLLTGLPNRTLLFDRLKQAMHTAARGERQLAVLCLDLDGFKRINDSLGHDQGDLLLRMVADRLNSGLRVADTVARLGGDEFVILAQGLRDRDDATTLAVKTQEQLGAPFELRGQRLTLTACVGISLYPADEVDADSLLRHADAAMQQAKQSGSAQLRFYDLPDAGAKGEGERPNLNRDIGAALAAGEFELRLLPVFDASGAVAACIADFCWRHSRYGEISSAETLRASRRHGLNAGIEAWQLRESLRQIQPGQGLPPLPVLLPLTARQWRDPEFAERLRSQLTDFRVPFSQLLPLLDGEDWADAAAPIQVQWSGLLRQGLRLALRAPPEGARLDGVGLLLLPAETVAAVDHREESLEPIRRHAALGRPLLLEAAPAGAPGARLLRAGASYLCGAALQPPLRPVDFINWVDSRPLRPL